MTSLFYVSFVIYNDYRRYVKGKKALTDLSPKLRTRHVRYAAFPTRAVTLVFCEKSKVGSGFAFSPEEWSSNCCRGLVWVACLSMLSIVRSPRLSVSETKRNSLIEYSKVTTHVEWSILIKVYYNALHIDFTYYSLIN